MVSVLDSGAGVKEVYYGICASREYANHARSELEQDPLSHFKRLQMEIVVFFYGKRLEPRLLPR